MLLGLRWSSSQPPIGINFVEALAPILLVGVARFALKLAIALGKIAYEHAGDAERFVRVRSDRFATIRAPVIAVFGCLHRCPPAFSID
jgi:hypothetical protein